MDGELVVIAEGRFERFGDRCRVVTRGGGYWQVDRPELAPRAGSAWCRIEGVRSGFSNVEVREVRRIEDGEVLFSAMPFWYSLETLFVGAIAVVSFVMLVFDVLDRVVNPLLSP